MSEPNGIDWIERPPEGLWQRLRAEPDRAPELIALAAAERFGPQAQRWVGLWPGYEPADLAKVAFKKHVRLARLEGGAFGMGGAMTAIPDLVLLAWIQCRMVFYIAAAYGYDPSHPMRPAELLTLQEIYPSAIEARESLDGIGKSMAVAFAETRLTRSSDRPLLDKLMRYAVRRAVRKGAMRLVPLVGAPIGAVQNAGVTKELGEKALVYYGGDQARP